MLDLSKDERIYNVSSLFSLFIYCPFGRDTGKSCPFYKFRKLNELHKYYLAENIGARHRDQLLSRHYACYETRLDALNVSRCGCETGII